MRANLKVFFTVLLLMMVKPFFAQEKGKIFSEYYSPKKYDAWPQNWSVVEHPNNLLYFGNHKGMLQYDGTNWRLYEIANSSTTRALDVTPEGLILAGGINEMGFFNVNENGDLHYNSLKPKMDSSQLEFGDVWSVKSTDQGWFFLTDDFLFRFNNNKYKNYKKKGKYFYLLHTIDDTLYLQDLGYGLSKFQNDSIVMAPGGEYYASKRIHALLPYKNKMIAFTRGKGAFIYNPKGKDTTSWSIDAISQQAKALNDFLIQNTVYHGIKFSDSVYAIATINSGAILFNNNFKVLDIVNEASTGLKHSIYYLHYTHRGNLWMALENGIQKAEIGTPFRYWDENTGLVGSFSDIANVDDSVYISTGRGLFKMYEGNNQSTFNIDIFKPVEGVKSQVWSLVVMDPSKFMDCNPEALDEEKIISEYTVNKKTLLAAAGKNIIAVEDLTYENVLEYRGIYLIYPSESDPSKLYLGLREGFARVQYCDGTWYDDGKLKNIKGQVRSIKEDRYGNIWFSSIYKGIYKIPADFLKKGSKISFHELTDTIKFYDTTNGLPTNHGIHIMKAKDQIKFFTEDGIYNFDYSIERFYKDTSIGENYVDSTWKGEMYINPQENLWINATNDLHRGPNGNYYSDSLTFRRLQDYLVNFIALDKHDRLWIGAPKGVFRYSPGKPHEVNIDYPVLIRKVKTLHDSVLFYGINYKKIQQRENTKLEPHFSSHINKEIILPYKHNTLSFIYSAAYFIEEEKNLYSYRLHGFDDEWSKWVKETKKEYTNLTEGKYVFEVKAKNLYGVESQPATFSFEILPPWHRTTVAYIIYSILFLAFLFLIVRLYNYRLIKEKEKLERIVKERTQEILVQKEEIIVQAEHLREANEKISAKNRALEEQKEEISKQADKLKRANIQLLKLSKVASETDNSIAIFDKKGNIQWVNDGFTRLYGYDLYSFRKEKCENILESSENPNIKEAVKACIDEKKNVTYEFKTKTKYGKEVWVQTTLTHVTNKKGETTNLIAIDTDITRLKKAEYEILEQKRKLEEQKDLLEFSNATKDKFFRIIAHDLRSPISTLVTSTDFILSDFDEHDKDQTREFITELNRLSQTTFNLLENLLEWSSSQMGDIQYRPVNINMYDITMENIELISRKINTKDISLHTDIEKGLTAFADENMIKTVIRNILSNAVKFTPLGGAIRIKAKERDDWIYYSIADSGIGIDQEGLGKLFRIEKHHTTPGLQNEKGSGLGLIICKEFIEKNHGTISVTSKKGKGTTVHFRLKRTP